MQCPANLSLLLLILSDSFGRFPYKISLLILSLHETPSTIRSILVYVPSKLFSCVLVSVHASEPYKSIDSAIYSANYRSPRTRANSARIRQQFADTYTPPNSAERSPEFGGVRSSSPEFARTPPRTGEQFARKFVRGMKSQPPLTRFAANEVRREPRSPRTTTLANMFAKNS